MFLFRAVLCVTSFVFLDCVIFLVTLHSMWLFVSLLVYVCESCGFTDSVKWKADFNRVHASWLKCSRCCTCSLRAVYTAARSPPRSNGTTAIHFFSNTENGSNGGTDHGGVMKVKLWCLQMILSWVFAHVFVSQISLNSCKYYIFPTSLFNLNLLEHFFREWQQINESLLMTDEPWSWLTAAAIASIEALFQGPEVWNLEAAIQIWLKGKQLSLFNSNSECLVMLLSRLDYVCGIETTTLEAWPMLQPMGVLCKLQRRGALGFFPCQTGFMNKQCLQVCASLHLS
jgi:hypothetical protein